MRGRFVGGALAAVAAMTIGTGCAIYRGVGQDAVTFNTAVAPDSAIRVAETELTRAGYGVVKQGRTTVTTTLHDTPAGADTSDGGQHYRFWMMRVDAAPSALNNGTDVRVAGYFIPDIVADSATVARAVPVTAANARVFEEVRQAADRIQKAIPR